MKKLGIIGLCIVLSSFSLSKDPFQILEMAIKNYSETHHYSFSYQISWDCQVKTVQQSVQGSFIRNMDDFIHSQADNVTLHSGGYLLNINHRDKVIIVQRSDSELSFDQMFEIINMEQSMVEGTHTTNQYGQLLTFASKPNTPLAYVKKSTVQLNHDGWITSVKTVFNEQYQQSTNDKCRSMEITYTGYSVGKVNTQKLQLSNYVNIKGDEVRAVGAYKNYQIVSSLKYQKE